MISYGARWIFFKIGLFSYSRRNFFESRYLFENRNFLAEKFALNSLQMQSSSSKKLASVDHDGVGPGGGNSTDNQQSPVRVQFSIEVDHRYISESSVDSLVGGSLPGIRKIILQLSQYNFSKFFAFFPNLIQKD